MAVDEQKLNAFLGKAVGDLSASMSAVLMLIGDELGLYSALAKERLSAAELAQRTGTVERYVREWLANQAAGGYVAYDPPTRKYTLPQEQGLAPADETSDVFLPGSYQTMAAMFLAEPRIAANFRTGAGLDWCEHDRRLFTGTER